MWSDYDTPEMDVLNRMKQELVRDDGWTREDFEGMTFLDVEAEYLDTHEDFR